MYDVFRFLAGAPACSVSATAIDPGTLAYARTDNFSATLSYEDGSVATLLYTALGPKGLKIVAVSIDTEGKEQDIHDFAKQFGLTFDVLHDASGAIQDIYRTAGVPETMVIARDGTIRRKWTGADDWNSADNRTLLAQLLAEPRP